MSKMDDALKALKERNRILENKAGVAIAPAKPADDRPRWPSGQLKDPLDRFEEENPDIAALRQVEDDAFGLENLDKIKKYMNLKNAREKQQRRAEQEERDIARLKAADEYRQKQQEAEKAKVEDADAKRQAEVDEWYKTGGASPMPK